VVETELVLKDQDFPWEMKVFVPVGAIERCQAQVSMMVCRLGAPRAFHKHFTAIQPKMLLPAQLLLCQSHWSARFSLVPPSALISNHFILCYFDDLNMI